MSPSASSTPKPNGMPTIVSSDEGGDRDTDQKQSAPAGGGADPRGSGEGNGLRGPRCEQHEREPEQEARHGRSDPDREATDESKTAEVHSCRPIHGAVDPTENLG